jgi:membrane-bound metal-dependent hydrolase YbcI (DUF457 family)
LEPITNALTALTLARAGQRRLPRFGAAILVSAGVAPDLDYASYFGGAGTFLRLHRAALHSVAGAAVVASVTAGVFWAIDRRRGQGSTEPAATQTEASGPRGSGAGAKPPLRFVPALIAALVGVSAHVLLGIASGVGVELLWPFGPRRYAWNLLANLDPWILIFLLAGLLIPELLRLVSEEIGERRKRVRGRTAAVLALAAFACYVGGRAVLQSRALDLLTSSDYNKQAPLSAGAFPSSVSPFDWRGVVLTDNTIEEVSVPLGPGSQFSPDRSLTRFKPPDSRALEAGESASATRLYLRYARFPLASVEQREDGYRFEVHDLQFAEGDANFENTFVRVDLNGRLQVVREEILFAASPEP